MNAPFRETRHWQLNHLCWLAKRHFWDSLDWRGCTK